MDPKQVPEGDKHVKNKHATGRYDDHRYTNPLEEIGNVSVAYEERSEKAEYAETHQAENKSREVALCMAGGSGQPYEAEENTADAHRGQ